VTARFADVGTTGQFGFFDADKRLAAISAKGDPLEMIALVMPFESFCAEIEAAVLTLAREKSKADRRHRYVSDAGAALALQSVRRTGRVSGAGSPVVRAVSAIVLFPRQRSRERMRP
jgi:hypothetical protein